MLYGAEGLHFAIAGVAHNGPRRPGALLQRQFADLIGVGKARFSPLTARTPTPWSILYDPSLMMLSSRTRGFVIARLKIEIAVIEAALGQLTKNGKQVLMIQAICRQ